MHPVREVRSLRIDPPVLRDKRQEAQRHEHQPRSLAVPGLRGDPMARQMKKTRAVYGMLHAWMVDESDLFEAFRRVGGDDCQPKGLVLNDGRRVGPQNLKSF